MRWTLLALVLAAVGGLIASSGACGSSITIPDQGIIVTGCQQPASCISTTCMCHRGDVLGTDMGPTPTSCVVACVPDPMTGICECPAGDGDAGTEDTQCLEPSMACVGRGVFCGGAGALCVPAGSACSASTPGAAPPMLISTIGMPGLEPRCQYVDDVCCPGAAPTDGGIVTD